MPEDDLEAAIDRLSAEPLEAFVAERTRLARELRAGGDRAAAAELAKLSKPSAAVWALNHVAREERDAVGAWFDASAALRDASAPAAEVDGGVLRAAIAEHRAATERLLALVRDRARPGGRPLSGPMLDRVRSLLQSAAADPGLAERLRAARVTEEPGVPVPEAQPAAERTTSTPAQRRREPDADHEAGEAEARDAEARARRKAELERGVAAAAEEAQGLREEAAARAAAAAAADERLEEARRTLQHAESEVAATHDTADEAEAAAGAAERELERLRARLRDA